MSGVAPCCLAWVLPLVFLSGDICPDAGKTCCEALFTVRANSATCSSIVDEVDEEEGLIKNVDILFLIIYTRVIASNCLNIYNIYISSKIGLLKKIIFIIKKISSDFFSFL